MTTHVRTQIRNAAVAALTGLATTGSRVHASRMRPKGDAALPCLLVVVGDEAIEHGAQRRQQRSASVIVRGLAKATDALDDTLDAIALQVETALAMHRLGGLVPGGLILNAINTDFDDALDKPAGVVDLHFSAGYFTRAGEPGTTI